MAEQNTNYAADNGNLDSPSFSVHDILQMVLRNWYWFGLSVFVCLLFAAFYLKTTPKIYHREATILVKDSRKGGDMDITALSDLSGVSTRRNVDNEVYVLQSRRLMRKVVDKLNLTINYTTEGTFRKIDLYRRSPIEVTFINNIPQQSLAFSATLQPDSTVLVTNFSIEDSRKDVVKGHLGDTISTPIGQIVINPTLYLHEKYFGQAIDVSKGNIEAVVNAYRGAVHCNVANKLSSIVTISMNNTVAQRADDVINTLINAYNDDAIDEKRSVSRATAKFIADRLEVVGRELGDVDRNIEEFKKKNQVIDLSTEASRSLSESSKYKSESLELENQIQMAEYIKEYLLDKSNINALIPTIVGINNANINTQITTYNVGVLRREKLATEASTNSPVISQLDRELAAIRQSIIAALDSHISTLRMQLSTFRNEEEQANSRITSAPTQEKAILSITRQQRVKEELYLYLLNKREENELAHAITESNARVIDFSFGPAAPVAPKSSIIMLAALLIGLGIPFVIFYMLEMLNTSIRGRKDIEDNLSVPFLGDIPQHTGSTVKGIAVRENGRDTVSEAFRMLRSNMTFMNAQSEKMKTILITSSNPHAGKTFITMNTAMTLAMTDKKVVLLDLDLRRRTLSKYLGKGSAEGMSGYISGTVTDIREVIIPSGIHKT
ncbi:MAG: chromosome partitioning protein ParA, partial [Alistipes sp.]|nr:chromosome partitioning protein ParA [Alistipes sp.]